MPPGVNMTHLATGRLVAMAGSERCKSGCPGGGVRTCGGLWRRRVRTRAPVGGLQFQNRADAGQVQAVLKKGADPAQGCQVHFVVPAGPADRGGWRWAGSA